MQSTRVLNRILNWNIIKSFWTECCRNIYIGFFCWVKFRQTKWEWRGAMKKTHFTFPIWSCPFSEVIFVAVADNVEMNKRSTVPCKPILKKNKDDNFLWWQNKWWRYLLIPQPGSKWRVFPCQSDFILAAVTPGDLDSAPSGQVARERLSMRKRNFDRSELPGSRTQICTPRWWELLVTIDT